MSRLFVRIYVGALVALGLAVAITMPLVAVGWRSMITRHLEDVHAMPMWFARDRLESATTDAEVQGAIEQLEESLGYEVAVVSHSDADLDDGEQARLAEGRVVTVFRDRQPVVFAVWAQPDSLVRLGPFEGIRPDAENRLYISLGAIFLAMAAVMIFLVRPIERRLSRLAKTAEEFGHGRLEQRAEDLGGDAIGRLAKDFNQMAGRISDLIGGQQDLLHAVAHELRTPMARLRFALETLSTTNDPEKLEQRIKRMDADLVELNELVSEILTYERLRHGSPKLKLEQINVSEVAVDVAAAVAPLRPQIDIEVRHADVEHLAQADSRLLKRAILNYASNAVRYAAEKIEISCYEDETDIWVDVDDDGPGVPEEDRRRIFEPFSRLDHSRTRKTGGFGLGLAIASRVAKWHHGSVSVSSSEAGGARFSIRFPKTQTGSK